MQQWNPDRRRAKFYRRRRVREHRRVVRQWSIVETRRCGTEACGADCFWDPTAGAWVCQGCDRLWFPGDALQYAPPE